MAMTANLQRANMPGMMCPATNGINWAGHVIKCALFNASFTPSLDTIQGYAVTNEATGTGYTAGGATVTGCTNTYYAANSWTSQWTSGGIYQAGDIVRPITGNGHVYQADVGGTASSTQPTWTTTRGSSYTDGDVTWVESGLGVNVLNCNAPSWTCGATPIQWQYGEFYDSTATYVGATAQANPIICIVNWGALQTGPSPTGVLSLTIDVNGGVLAMPVY